MESAARSWPQEIDPDIFMLIYERDENPVDVEFLLHYRSYQGGVGIFAYSMFAIIVGFNVKRHRATSLGETGNLEITPRGLQVVRKHHNAKGRQKPFSTMAFPTDYILTNYRGLSKT
jgi:hypothetical protein